jgi:hypothetical protein
MPTNEDGEFELILGNKQLLSVFFIVVVLLGVFFTMGYIVGRNTAPANTQVAAGKDDTPATDSPAEPPQSERPSPTAPPPEAKAADPPTRTASPPGQEAPRAEPPPAEPRKQETARSAPVKPEPADRATPPIAEGTYWQVAATRKSEADLLAEVLTKKGYPTTTAPVPGTELTRVLVGPYHDAETLNRTKTALDAAGFKPFPRPSSALR